MQRTEDWIREAEAELKAAKDLLVHGHWSWCCFTCQQASEKALKTIGEHFRQSLIGNNLNLLPSELQTFANIPESVRQACARLNQYYTLARWRILTNLSVGAGETCPNPSKN